MFALGFPSKASDAIDVYAGEGNVKHGASITQLALWLSST